MRDPLYHLANVRFEIESVKRGIRVNASVAAQHVDEVGHLLRA
jgi:hypothetical protein